MIGDPCLITKLEVLLPDIGAFGYPQDRCELAGTIRNGSAVANPSIILFGHTGTI